MNDERHVPAPMLSQTCQERCQCTHSVSIIGNSMLPFVIRNRQLLKKSNTVCYDISIQAQFSNKFHAFLPRILYKQNYGLVDHTVCPYNGILNSRHRLLKLWFPCRSKKSHTCLTSQTWLFLMFCDTAWVCDDGRPEYPDTRNLPSCIPVACK